MKIAIGRSPLALIIGALLISTSAAATSLVVRPTLITQANAAQLGFQLHINRCTEKTSICDIWVRVPPQVNGAAWSLKNTKGGNEAYFQIALITLPQDPTLQESKDAFDKFIEKGFYGVHITVPYSDAMKGRLSFSKLVGKDQAPVAAWMIKDLLGWLDKIREH